MSGFAETKERAKETKNNTSATTSMEHQTDFTFYNDKFPRPPHLPTTIFQLSVANTRHPLETHNNACLHPRCQGWDLRTCVDCNADLGQHRLDEETRQKRQAEQEDAEKAQRTPHVDRIHRLGIRIAALLAFAYDHKCWSWPTWKVVRDIIVPATTATRCRYGELPETSGCFGPATVFMSHCWGALFGDVVGAACHGAKKDRIVWIDIFAVRQWPGNGADLDFRSVLGKCNATIVSVSPVEGMKQAGVQVTLRNQTDNAVTWATVDHTTKTLRAFLSTNEGQKAKKTLPFCRLWCIVEIAASILQHIPVVVKFGCAQVQNGTCEYPSMTHPSIGGLMNAQMDNLAHLIDVQLSECAVQADYDREMAVVRSMTGGVEQVNAVIMGVVIGAAQTQRAFGYNGENVGVVDAYVCGEHEALRALGEGDEGGALRAACAGGRVEVVRELLVMCKRGEEERLKAKQEAWNKYTNVPPSNRMEKQKQLSVFHRAEDKVNWLKNAINGALKIASSGGHASMVELLLGVEGVDANASACHGNALHAACKAGGLDVVQLLCRTGMDVNQPNIQGSTPLFQACMMHHTNIVEFLLSEENIDVDKSLNDGQSPLFAAAEGGCEEIVRLLVAAGCNVNKRVHNTAWCQGYSKHCSGLTPLGIACKMDNPNANVIQVLLEAGACEFSHALFRACEAGALDVVKILCRAGMDVNQPNKDGCTPLFQASMKNHTSIVEFLLREENIDVDRSLNDGQSPLFAAAEGGFEEIVRLLIAAGCDVNMRVDNPSCFDPNCSGLTPLGIACKMDNPNANVIQVLLEAGACE